MSEQQQYPTREQIAEVLQLADIDSVAKTRILVHLPMPKKYLRMADAVHALFPEPDASAEPGSEQYATTTEYAYGTLDTPDIIVPTGEDIDDLGTARYNADEFWIDVLQRTVKRGPWQVVPSEVDPTPGTES